jgi:hypothetical protein
MSVVQVFPSFVMLSLASVFVRDGLPSVEMWFARGEDRCFGLSKVGMVETVGFHSVMWFVMLESTTDWIIGVETPGQHVPPCVRYGIACLLIRYAIGCASCSIEWRWHHTLWSVSVTFLWTARTTSCKRGCFAWETIALQAGTVCWETVAKHDILCSRRL